MSRSYPAEHVRLLHEHLSGSVVELVAFERKDYKISHLGTGVIVCCDNSSGCIGIITTISCDPKDYLVRARFADQKSMETEVLLRGRVLSGLVIRGYDGAAEVTPVTLDESFEENPKRSEPVWTAGCFSDNLDEIMPGGYICVLNIAKIIRNKDLVRTFVHSCPIGDGLIGAPVINRFGKILGITIARSKETATLNHGMRFEELKKELADLADGANNEESMSSLLRKFSQSLLRRVAKKRGTGSSSRKMKRTDAGSSSSKKPRRT